MKIMFVCTGNICRSAMAEWLLKKKIEERKIENIEVCSSGIYAQDFETPTWEVKTLMKDKYNIDMNKHKAINIKNSNADTMDLILCATNSHKIAVLDMYPELLGKVFTMKQYTGYNRYGHEGMNIKDPWGYDIYEYRSCLEEIDECLELLLEKIQNREQTR